MATNGRPLITKLYGRAHDQITLGEVANLAENAGPLHSVQAANKRHHFCHELVSHKITHVIFVGTHPAFEQIADLHFERACQPLK